MTRLEFLQKNTKAWRDDYMEIYNNTPPSERLSLKKISLPVDMKNHKIVELYESLTYKGMYYVYVLTDFTRVRCNDAVGKLTLTFKKYKEFLECDY